MDVLESPTLSCVSLAFQHLLRTTDDSRFKTAAMAIVAGTYEGLSSASSIEDRNPSGLVGLLTESCEVAPFLSGCMPKTFAISRPDSRNRNFLANLRPFQSKSYTETVGLQSLYAI